MSARPPPSSHPSRATVIAGLWGGRDGIRHRAHRDLGLAHRARLRAPGHPHAAHRDRRGPRLRHGPPVLPPPRAAPLARHRAGRPCRRPHPVYAALVPLTPARLGRRSRSAVLTGVVDDLTDVVEAHVRVRVPVLCRRRRVAATLLTGLSPPPSSSSSGLVLVVAVAAAGRSSARPSPSSARRARR